VRTGPALVCLVFEDRQISSGVCSPQGGVDVFAGTVSLFSEAEVRKVSENLSDLLLLNAVLPRHFVNDVRQSDKACNLQRDFLLPPTATAR